MNTLRTRTLRHRLDQVGGLYPAKLAQSNKCDRTDRPMRPMMFLTYRRLAACCPQWTTALCSYDDDDGGWKEVGFAEGYIG